MATYGQINAENITSSTGGVISPNITSLRNRIINGAMVIDQRDAGASVTITNTSAGTYVLDRWQGYGTVASKFSIQQNAGSVTPPIGYINYLGVTSASAYSVGSTDRFQVAQAIEGLNIADLAWGTANAKTVTLSFWVYSSLTGSFGGSLGNQAGNYQYPFSYSIPVANTWTQINVTITGATSGTWLTTNGVGVYVLFGLGVGSSLSGTAGAWTTSTVYVPTGSVSVVGTNGATFYITGVQLDVGTQTTSFDYRPYGTELALCQRYYQIGMYTGKQYQSLGLSSNQSTTSAETIYQFKTSMRSPPTLSYANGSYYFVYANSTTYAFSSLTQDSNYLNTESSSISATISGATTGQAGSIRQSNVLGFVAFSAEL